MSGCFTVLWQVRGQDGFPLHQFGNKIAGRLEAQIGPGGFVKASTMFRDGTVHRAEQTGAVQPESGSAGQFPGQLQVQEDQGCGQDHSVIRCVLDGLEECCFYLLGEALVISRIIVQTNQIRQ